MREIFKKADMCSHSCSSDIFNAYIVPVFALERVYYRMMKVHPKRAHCFKNCQSGDAIRKSYFKATLRPNFFYQSLQENALRFSGVRMQIIGFASLIINLV